MIIHLDEVLKRLDFIKTVVTQEQAPRLSDPEMVAVRTYRLLVSQDVGKIGFRQISLNIYILYQKWSP